MSRAGPTQGVKLIRVDEGDEIAAITQLDEKEEETDAITGEVPGEILPGADESETGEATEATETE